MCHLKEPVPDSFVPPKIVTPFSVGVSSSEEEPPAIKSVTPATNSLAIFNILAKKRKNPCDPSDAPPLKIRSPPASSLLMKDSSSSPLNGGDSKKEQNLIDAARSGNINALKSFLDDSTCDVNHQDLHGNTALHFAIFNNQVQVAIKLLASPKINLDSVNRLGMTPLLSAVEYGHSGLVRMLVTKGADVSLFDNQGFTVLHKAVLTGNMEILRYLLDNCEFIPLNAPSNDQRLTPLHQAAFHGNTSAIKLLLKAGCNVSPLSSHKTTPLHMAALKNHSKAVSILLRHGSSPDQQDNHDRTALHYACLYGHLDSASVLCENGCSVSLDDFKNQSPLLLAARGGFGDLLSLLTKSA